MKKKKKKKKIARPLTRKKEMKTLRDAFIRLCVLRAICGCPTRRATLKFVFSNWDTSSVSPVSPRARMVEDRARDERPCKSFDSRWIRPSNRLPRFVAQLTRSERRDGFFFPLSFFFR